MIDPNIYDTPATKGDVAGVAIQTTVAIRSIQGALMGLKSGRDITVYIDQIGEQADRLGKLFDTLAGWVDEH